MLRWKTLIGDQKLLRSLEGVFLITPKELAMGEREMKSIELKACS